MLFLSRKLLLWWLYDVPYIMANIFSNGYARKAAIKASESDYEVITLDSDAVLVRKFTRYRESIRSCYAFIFSLHLVCWVVITQVFFRNIRPANKTSLTKATISSIDECYDNEEKYLVFFLMLSFIKD